MKPSLVNVAALSALLALAPLPATAGRILSLYLDAALVEQQETATKGYIEISLPPGAAPESLRINPGRGVNLIRVSTASRKPAKGVARELEALSEREEQLQDRLKALAVREEIFKSAAKSQSAKAPRRTRTNPEPLSTIRQGTDYAITQLESVYQAKRKVAKELAQLADRRSRLQKDESAGGTVARVWVTPSTGTVKAAWIQSDRSWTPSYQLRLSDGGDAALVMHGNGVTLAKGEAATLYLSSLQTAVPRGFPYESDSVPLQKIPVQATNLQGGPPQTPFSLSLANTSDVNLPAGATACYKGGVYMGKGAFKGADSGKSVELICSGG